MSNNLITMSLIYALIIVAFYYFLIRPQRKREKETQQMRKSLNEGDEIITIGGIYGKVVNIKEDLITVEVNADKAKIKIARWAVGKVVEKEKV